jgi:hypothetical protein
MQQLIIVTFLEVKSQLTFFLLSPLEKYFPLVVHVISSPATAFFSSSSSSSSSYLDCSYLE